jgi:hypothetical protein
MKTGFAKICRTEGGDPLGDGDPEIRCISDVRDTAVVTDTPASFGGPLLPLFWSAFGGEALGWRERERGGKSETMWEGKNNQHTLAVFQVFARSYSAHFSTRSTHMVPKALFLR